MLTDLSTTVACGRVTAGEAPSVVPRSNEGVVAAGVYGQKRAGRARLQ